MLRSARAGPGSTDLGNALQRPRPRSRYSYSGPWEANISSLCGHHLVACSSLSSIPLLAIITAVHLCSLCISASCTHSYHARLHPSAVAAPWPTSHSESRGRPLGDPELAHCRTSPLSAVRRPYDVLDVIGFAWLAASFALQLQHEVMRLIELD